MDARFLVMEQFSRSRRAAILLCIVVAGCSLNIETRRAGRHFLKVPAANLVETLPWGLLSRGNGFMYIVDPAIDSADQITVLVQDASEFCRGTRDANHSVKTCGATPIWAFDPGKTSKLSRVGEGLSGSDSYYSSDTGQPIVSCFPLGSPSERGDACTALLQYADLACVVSINEKELGNLGRIGTRIRAQLTQWEVRR